ncbi:class II glutamine amidotransferase [Trichloromonas sp.]|uniref:class II glutamine amidotransferase n=1 Tax=Trichloromonas sp. TaxID=3069249 RepID=UPI003D818B33
MCRVLGITHFDYTKHEKIVARFCGLARSGIVMTGDPPGHEDGWGLAFYQQGQLVVHKSGGNMLDEADQVFDLLRAARTSPAMILHLRKSAWANTSSTRHAHPFFLGNTVFFHNGVVYDYQNLLPAMDRPELPDDARDTEVLFYHVLSQKAPDLGRAFLDSAAIIQQNHKFSALNCLFSDGKTFYAYRDYAKEADYYSLYRATSENSCLISSEPLDDSLHWEMMAQEEFLAMNVTGS